MIDAERFFVAWTQLCKRFGRKVDEDEAGEYLAFLEDAGLSTDEALAEARGAWATREFFPRPADFLQGQGARGWAAALAWARGWSPTMDARAALALVDAVPSRAKRALDAIGGIDAIRNARDLIRVRTEFFDAFGRVLVEEVTAVALPSAPDRPLLEEPGEQVEIVVGGKGARVHVDLLRPSDR